MHLPADLIAAIEKEVAQADRARLAQAAEQFSLQYRAADFSAPPIKTETQRAAYLAVRLPATYAAAWHVMNEVRRLAPAVEVSSVLDLGAGPGTAAHAAAEVFSELRQATLLESDPAWLPAGKRIASQSASPALQQARWMTGDLRRADWQKEFPSAPDMVVIAYALGELQTHEAASLVLQAWKLCAKFLLIVEPGTTRGFGTIIGARTALITHGARILAPCPHQGTCPMVADLDWCHFAQRLERTALHRRLKGGDLGYEDEKFSYLVASKVAAETAPARIVRHPRTHSGHIKLTLCTPEGLQSTTVARSQKRIYRQARRAAWGDAWSPAADTVPNSDIDPDATMNGPLDNDIAD
jgi:ribosomal protein RSM22 (predicted rRNA methylase)